MQRAATEALLLSCRAATYLSAAAGRSSKRGWASRLPPLPPGDTPQNSPDQSASAATGSCPSSPEDPQQQPASTSSTQHPHPLHHALHGTNPNPARPSPHLHGLLRLLPAPTVPYAQLMRLDKPIGTWLLAWPCAWSIALAAEHGQAPDLQLLALFGCGALLLRGAGCTINDLWDRDLDKAVARTSSRPLASGALTPAHAIAFLALQLSLGLGILLQLNTYSQVLGASSLLLVATYPLFKRFTHWPQAYLGLTINWGAIMGYAAVQGHCDWAVVLPLYTAGLFWTLMYDTIYAHQDKQDDVKVGIRSTALLLGDSTKPWLLGFAACSSLGLLAAGAAAGCSWPYYAAAGGAAAHMAWQIRAVDLDDGPDCMRKFVSNKWVGAIVFAGCVAGRLL